MADPRIVCRATCRPIERSIKNRNVEAICAVSSIPDVVSPGDGLAGRCAWHGHWFAIGNPGRRRRAVRDYARSLQHGIKHTVGICRRHVDGLRYQKRIDVRIGILVRRGIGRYWLIGRNCHRQIWCNRYLEVNISGRRTGHVCDRRGNGATDRRRRRAIRNPRRIAKGGIGQWSRATAAPTTATRHIKPSGRKCIANQQVGACNGTAVDILENHVERTSIRTYTRRHRRIAGRWDAGQLLLNRD